MTHEEAALIQRKQYLESEMAVWTARRERALASGSKPLMEFYINDEMDKAMGQMRGDLFRIKLELGEAVMGDANQPKPRVKGKRRPKAA